MLDLYRVNYFGFLNVYFVFWYAGIRYEKPEIKTCFPSQTTFYPACFIYSYNGVLLTWYNFKPWGVTHYEGGGGRGQVLMDDPEWCSPPPHPKEKVGALDSIDETRVKFLSYTLLSIPLHSLHRPISGRNYDR